MKFCVLSVFLILLVPFLILYAEEADTQASHFGFIRCAFVSEPFLESQAFSVFHARWGMKGKV
ncbi:MAG: hypothetical protein PWP06_685, partial [Candidatus Marinimicrobia bacterium]|nr:hypothetical protein [Candidatus Neomarinimicrobiota bacterium]